MNRAPETRSPAPRANAENRAEIIRNDDLLFTIARPEPETNSAAIAALAGMGRAFT